MSNKVKHITDMSSQMDSQQSGFVILMGLLILVLGAAAWYGSVGGVKSERMKADTQGEYVTNLQHVKERMLAYAVLNPEIFDGGPLDMSTNPGPGYFPCPDITGNGTSDTGVECSEQEHLFGLGWVPQKIIERNFSFLSSSQLIENKRYWFAVDTRFTVDGAKYSYDTSNRFAPLNINTPSLVDTTGVSNCDGVDGIDGQPISANCIPPLTLDGEGDIVMVLMYGGDQPTTEYSIRRRLSLDGSQINNHASGQSAAYLEQGDVRVVTHWNSGNRTGEFVSTGDGSGFFNDYVIAITREEWNMAMLSRVAKDADRDGDPDLCDASLNVEANDKNSWFDGCRYSGAAPPYPCTDIATLPGAPVENIEGQGWREALGCPL